MDGPRRGRATHRRACAGRGAALIAVVWAALAPLRADEPPTAAVTAAPPLALAGTEWLDLTPDATLAPWQVIEGSFFEKHGAVARTPAGFTLAAGAGGTGVRLARTPPTEDFEVELEARRTGGEDFFLGLTVPVGPSHVTLILGGWGGGLTGLSNIDGYAADENVTTGHVDFKDGTWVKVRMKVTKARIEAWVDAAKIVDVERGDHRFEVWWQQEAARPLGLTTWKTGAEYRNLRLRRTAAPPAAAPAEPPAGRPAAP